MTAITLVLGLRAYSNYVTMRVYNSERKELLGCYRVKCGRTPIYGEITLKFECMHIPHMTYLAFLT